MQVQGHLYLGSRLIQTFPYGCIIDMPMSHCLHWQEPDMCAAPLPCRLPAGDHKLACAPCRW